MEEEIMETLADGVLVIVALEGLGPVPAYGALLACEVLAAVLLEMPLRAPAFRVLLPLALRHRDLTVLCQAGGALHASLGIVGNI